MTKRPALTAFKWWLSTQDTAWVWTLVVLLVIAGMTTCNKFEKPYVIQIQVDDCPTPVINQYEYVQPQELAL